MQPEQLSEAITAAHESLSGRWSISKEAFAELTRDWEVFPVQLNGVIVGALLRKETELHACIKPEGFGRWFNKSMKRIVDSTVERYGFASTTVTDGNLVGDKFVKRLGFERCGTRFGNWIYRKVKNGT